jgi:hypothetical protein
MPQPEDGSLTFFKLPMGQPVMLLPEAPVYLVYDPATPLRPFTLNPLAPRSPSAQRA